MKKLILVSFLIAIAVGSAFANLTTHFKSNVDPYDGTQQLGYVLPWSAINVSSYTLPIKAEDIFLAPIAASTFSAYNVLIESGTITQTTRVFGTDVLTQPAYSRNIGVACAYQGGNETVSSVTYVIAGIDARGDSRTETLYATTPATVYFSSYAYIYVSSVTAKMTYNNNSAGVHLVRMNIGIGSSFGLTNKITAATDVYGVVEATTKINPGISQVLVNATYSTIQFVSAPNGSDNKIVFYRIRAAH